MNFRIKGWRHYQHYHDRRPSWIKLHRTLLDDAEYAALPPIAAKCLPLIWLIASESSGGVLPSIEILAWRLRITQSQVGRVLAACSHWLEQDASEVLAERYQDASEVLALRARSREVEVEIEKEVEIEPPPPSKPFAAKTRRCDRFFGNLPGVLECLPPEGRKNRRGQNLESVRPIAGISGNHSGRGGKTKALATMDQRPWTLYPSPGDLAQSGPVGRRGRDFAPP